MQHRLLRDRPDRMGVIQGSIRLGSRCCGMVDDSMLLGNSHGRMGSEVRKEPMTPEQARLLGRFIAEKRDALGMSQRKLAEAIGVQNTTIMRLEAGEYAAPSPDNLARIAETLGIEMADLYAMAEYLVPKKLPTLTPYLRAKYSELPDGAAEQIEAYAHRLAKRHGVDLRGPAPGVDEEPEITEPKQRITATPKKKGGTR
jgi:transcriptional regulator with XRE-family HTH domain